MKRYSDKNADEEEISLSSCILETYSIRLSKSPHGRNDFAERSKILLSIDLKIILLKIMNNVAKNFDILATSLSNILHNYFEFNNFSDLYLTKILDLSAKSIFPCTSHK